MSQRRKASIRALWAFIAAAGLALGAVLYMLLWPYNDFEIYGPTTIDGDEFYPGDFVTLTSEGFCNKGVDTVVTRVVSNDYGAIQLPTLVFTAPPSLVCESPYSSRVEIPHEVPPGEWKIEVVTSYHPNPIRTVDVVSTTPTFTVLPQEVP